MPNDNRISVIASAPVLQDGDACAPRHDLEIKVDPAGVVQVLVGTMVVNLFDSRPRLSILWCAHPVTTLAKAAAVNLLLGLALTEMSQRESPAASSTPVIISLTPPAGSGAARERYLAALAAFSELDAPTCDASIATRDEG